MRRSSIQLFVFVCAVFCIQSISTPARAASGDGNRWEFQLAPYIWMAGMKGEVATLPPLPPADIDLNFFDDIFDNIDGALLLVGEARKGRYGLVFDLIYINIEDDESNPGPYFTSVSSETESWVVSAAGLYRLFESKPAFLDAVAGIRYWSVDSELSLRGGMVGPRSVSNSEDWVDPIVGLKGLTPIEQSKFFLSGAVLIGGFGVGSDFMWDANANIGYQWTQRFSTTIGYRYMDVDYDEDDFLYDVSQQGPIVGLSWRF